MVIDLRKKQLKISRYELIKFKNNAVIEFITNNQCRFIKYYERYDSLTSWYTIFPIHDSWNLDKPEIAEARILEYYLRIKKYCDEKKIRCELLITEDL